MRAIVRSPSRCYPPVEHNSCLHAAPQGLLPPPPRSFPPFGTLLEFPRSLTFPAENVLQYDCGLQISGSSCVMAHCHTRCGEVVPRARGVARARSRALTKGTKRARAAQSHAPRPRAHEGISREVSGSKGAMASAPKHRCGRTGGAPARGGGKVRRQSGKREGGRKGREVEKVGGGVSTPRSMRKGRTAPGGTARSSHVSEALVVKVGGRNGSGRARTVEALAW